MTAVSTVLSVRDLKKSYRRQWSQTPVRALNGISFDVTPGSITGFLGANGAGKTTTIKCLFGLSLPDAGEVRFFGDQPLSNDVKRRIGFLPERPYFYEYLTGREFLKFYGQLSTTGTARDLGERISTLLKRVGLEQAGDRALRTYSKGMLQRVGIAQALIHRPELVVLDEPMTGLDPDGRFEVREIMRETARDGTAVFFSSHLLPDAEELCENLVILKSGELVYNGPTRNLLVQVENGFDLNFVKHGHPGSLKVEGVGALQTTIDRLRSEGAEILELRPRRLTLEEAFVKIAMNPRESRMT